MAATPRRRSPREQAEIDRRDRRQFAVLGILFTSVLLALTGLYVLGAEATDPPTPAQGAVEQPARPALDVPNSGHEPIDSGDRGGSEQLLLMGGLIVVLVGGAAYVVHSSRRSRRRLKAEEERSAADSAGGEPRNGDDTGSDRSESSGTAHVAG